MDSFDVLGRRYPRTLATLMVTRGMSLGEACSTLQMVQGRIQCGEHIGQRQGWVLDYARKFRKFARGIHARVEANRAIATFLAGV